MTVKAADFSQRNPAIDILRALVMLLMIFVNDLWSIRGEPHWLGHAAGGEDMLGLSDVVFPCFLFVVGMSIPYALESRFAKGLPAVGTVAHILLRSLALLVMGVFIVNSEAGVAADCWYGVAVYRLLMVAGFFLVWNVYPRTEGRKKWLWRALKWLGVAIMVVLAVSFRDGRGEVFAVRWWGILGLIGWSYLVCAFVYLFMRARLRWLVAVWLIFVALCVVRTATRGGEALLELPRGNALDGFLSIMHIGGGAMVALVMGGAVLSVAWVRLARLGRTRRFTVVLSAAALLGVLGAVCHNFWIVSKLSATPPWILWCMALATGTYVLLDLLVGWGKARWFDVVKPAGTATLTCYLVPYILYSAWSLTGWSLPEWLIGWPVGLFKCIGFAFLTVGVTWLLGKSRVKLKI